MTGEEFKQIQKALGLSNVQLVDKLDVSERTVGILRAAEVVEKRYELAIRALWFKVDKKQIKLPEVGS